eukprot:3074582-Amphidinium_carterae.1
MFSAHGVHTANGVSTPTPHCMAEDFHQAGTPLRSDAVSTDVLSLQWVAWSMQHHYIGSRS